MNIDSSKYININKFYSKIDIEKILYIYKECSECLYKKKIKDLNEIYSCYYNCDEKYYINKGELYYLSLIDPYSFDEINIINYVLKKFNFAKSSLNEEKLKIYNFVSNINNKIDTKIISNYIFKYYVGIHLYELKNYNTMFLIYLYNYKIFDTQIVYFFKLNIIDFFNKLNEYNELFFNIKISIYKKNNKINLIKKTDKIIINKNENIIKCDTINLYILDCLTKLYRYKLDNEEFSILLKIKNKVFFGIVELNKLNNNIHFKLEKI